MHMRGLPGVCMVRGSQGATPRRGQSCLGVERKIEERKLAYQETELGSKTEQRLHAYTWKSTHMRATSSQVHA
ncbi:hypothetical protein PIB30_098235 [Stylosanthes scabra]|uniref:Uncharacterized protein n=1 Tax=Stylosanthes scabra TaxID=79078 RepID=A0ABU6ZV64_9FABA|nr:hypothetical protein [Stylosanthes scabra]